MCSSSKKKVEYRSDQKKSEETIEIVKGAQAESSKMRYIDPAKTETSASATVKRFFIVCIWCMIYEYVLWILPGGGTRAKLLSRLQACCILCDAIKCVHFCLCHIPADNQADLNWLSKSEFYYQLLWRRPPSGVTSLLQKISLLASRHVLSPEWFVNKLC